MLKMIFDDIGDTTFFFCPRQWALIHIDQVWAENVKTMEGNIIHENCHNPDFVEKRGELLVSRG